MKRLLLLVAACAHPHAQPAGPDASSPPPPDAAAAPDAGIDSALWNMRADAALESLLVDYWTPGYFAATSPRTSTLTGYWTFAQAYDAVLDGVQRTGGAKFAGWAEGLYLAQSARGWSSNYYDDENWMTLALLRANYLTQAQSLYADIKAAWDTSCCGAHPGGIWWDRAHTQKATASNAGPVITAVRMGDLAFAKQVYAYWRTYMVDPQTYAVTDHIAPDGTLAHYRFTYNEGLMIGAAVELYGATQDPQYLADAHAIAGYMISAETKNGALFDGTDTHCTGDCAQFKGIGFRYLSELERIDPRPEEQAVLDASAQAIWDHARGAGDLFATDWQGPTMTPVPINAQSSAAMALNIYSPRETLTSDHYEAEDAIVRGIGLERSHAGFDGWAYLAGWNQPGQSVDFHVTVAAAGTYTVTLRYAAGAGDATRTIAGSSHTFASTGSWDTWATTTVQLQLPSGASTIAVAPGSNYLNLDWITVH